MNNNQEGDVFGVKKKIKVLMADDETEVLDILARKVESEGYEVVKANDGEEALNKIKAEDPDVILLDINMPNMNGFEVLLEVRKNPPSTKWQPIIIVSARSELHDMKKGYSLEADHYITKPSSMEDILKAIQLMVNLIPQRKFSADET